MTIIDNGDAGLGVRGILNAKVATVADRTALKAADTSQTMYLAEYLFEGLFQWDALVDVDDHQADTEEYRYVAPNPAADGAWVRQSGGSPYVVNTPDVIDLRPRVASREPKIERVWQLSDPTLAANYDTEVILTGQPPIRAYCDGVQWWNMADGTVISPWWLPRGAVVHVDFDNNRFFWDGAVKAITDLTDNGDGSYILTPASPISFSSGEQVIVFDSTMDMANASKGGSFWQIRQSTGNTSNLRAQPPTGTNAPIRVIGNYYATSGQTINLSLVSIDGESATYPATGRHRQMLRLKNGEVIRYLPDNGDYRQVNPSRTVTTIPDIALICLNCSYTASVGPAGPLSGAELHTLTMYNRDMTEIEREAVGRTGVAPPFHILGDSFMTLYYSQHYLAELVNGYIPQSTDAVGGTTLSQQAVRFATGTAKWRKSTVVVGDMGASFQMVEGLKDLLAYIEHDRWLVLEPAPQNDIGTDARDAWDRRRDALRIAAGPNWVPTLEAAYALSDLSVDDEAEVAKGLWPLSLKTSVSDFHPSRAGDEFLAATILAALQERGWAPE